MEPDLHIVTLVPVGSQEGDSKQNELCWGGRGVQMINLVSVPIH